MPNKNSLLKSIGRIERGVIFLDIRGLIRKLERKYQTRNPFDLATSLGILILKEDLGTINGYYNKQFRIKQIHINHNLPEHLQILTCAHELGHALLHPNSSTPFLRSFTFFSVDRMEIESNKFAVELLIPDDFMAEYQEYTTEQIARIMGYSEELIKLRLK